jgi:DNA topoisomerase-1
LEILSQPKTRSARGTGKTNEPLKSFDNSPVTDKPIKVLAGRFGNYVTDGTTNVTIPKGVTVEELTFDRVVDMLAEKAAKGPAPKTRKKTAAKKTAKKTTKKAQKK